MNFLIFALCYSYLMIAKSAHQKRQTRETRALPRAEMAEPRKAQSVRLQEAKQEAGAAKRAYAGARKKKSATAVKGRT